MKTGPETLGNFQNLRYNKKKNVCIQKSRNETNQKITYIINKCEIQC